jgi:hypothetical protein
MMMINGIDWINAARVHTLAFSAGCSPLRTANDEALV